MPSRRIVLHFPPRIVDQAIISRLVREYNLDFNILKASITPRKEGVLVMELSGSKEEYDQGIEYLTRMGVNIQPLSQDIVRNEDRCTHCGVCVGLCPTGALWVDRETRHVHFSDEKCVACEICVKICPPRAMEVKF